VQNPKKRRIRNLLIVLAVAALPGTCAYKFLTADPAERRCETIQNILRWDYSAEVASGVRLSADQSNIRLDFTQLKKWKRVCLVSMYEDTITDSGREQGPAGPNFYQVGRWQCSGGNLEDFITIALMKSDGGTLARQVKLPRHIWSRLIGTNYGGGLSDELYDAGHRVCSQIDEAVANCAWIDVRGRRGCLLVFRPDKTRE
jgi:hypothetical protein